MTDIDKLQNLRTQVQLDMERYIEDGFGPLELAAILVTQGLMIYRQVLDEDEYEIMTKDIYQNRNLIRRVIP